MSDEIQELLSTALGAELPESRQRELLARLRANPELRRAFAAELRMLGLLRAVQAPESRWLRLREELGLDDAEPAADASGLRDRLRPYFATAPRPRDLRWIWAAGAAAALLVAAFLGPARMRRADEPREAGLAADAESSPALLAGADGARWHPRHTPSPAPGAFLASGSFELEAGRITLSMVYGATVTVEGPAVFTFEGADRMALSRGRLRVHAGPGAEGFVVRTPRCAVVDLGTEFGVNVDAPGRTEVRVFDGRAEVSALDLRGDSRESALLKADDSAVVDAVTERLHRTPLDHRTFVDPSRIPLPALAIPPAYADAVRSAGPWGYWRFHGLAGGRVTNEIAGRPALLATGALRIVGDEHGGHQIEFPAAHPEQFLETESPWRPSRATGYAIETWTVLGAYSKSVVAAFSKRPGARSEPHSMFVELRARPEELLHRAGTVRFLHRWPPGADGGVNVFSRDRYVPYQWQHIVAQRHPDRIELYLNGHLAARTGIPPDDDTPEGFLVLGRRNSGLGASSDPRAFVGRMDEVAVYDRPLTPGEIRSHYDMALRPPADGLAASRP